MLLQGNQVQSTIVVGFVSFCFATVVVVVV